MRSYIILLIFIINILIFGCNNPDKTEIKKIYPSKSISKLSDTMFFSDIFCIEHKKNLFFYSDFNNSRIFITDTLLNYKNEIGNLGKGPGEFSGCTNVSLNNDNIYASDDGNRRINVYDYNGEFVKSFKSFYPNCPFLTRFAVSSDNKLLFISGRGLIYSVNNRGEKINQFKIKINSFFNKTEKTNSSRYIFIRNNKLILIPEDQPYFEEYTFNGDLIKRYDLSKLNCLKNTIKYLKENADDDPRTTDILFNDCYLTDNYLFLLYLDVLRSGEKTVNKIMKIEIKDNDYCLKKIYYLTDYYKGTWYDSFCVFDNCRKLVAFEGQNYQIDIFNL